MDAFVLHHESCLRQLEYFSLSAVVPSPCFFLFQLLDFLEQVYSLGVFFAYWVCFLTASLPGASFGAILTENWRNPPGTQWPVSLQRKRRGKVCFAASFAAFPQPATFTKDYSSSHNHGSGKWLYLKGNDPIGGAHFWTSMMMGGRVFPTFWFYRALRLLPFWACWLRAVDARAWTCTWKWHLGPWKGMTKHWTSADPFGKGTFGLHFLGDNTWQLLYFDTMIMSPEDFLLDWVRNVFLDPMLCLNPTFSKLSTRLTLNWPHFDALHSRDRWFCSII